jgi:uncharacterized protein YbbC (DUF1343 family)
VPLYTEPPGTEPFRTGLEVLEAEGFQSLRGKRVAVLTNPSGVTRDLRSTVDLVAAAEGVELAAIFAPEHGFSGVHAAGEKVGDARDPQGGVPVHSLYGATRRPSPEMLTGVDVVLFDVQDIGVRTYTYLSTLLEVLTAAASAGVEVWVLDRPVPIGADRVEGPVLEAGAESFVGAHTVALRHGLTAGEFALLVNDERRIGARLKVVAMQGYRREARFEDLGLPWVPPSPNIPTPATALVYAGTVLVEGTNLSEGRGTAQPFQLVGAPWLDGRRLAAELNRLRLPGVRFRAASFRPAASKYAGEDCSGIAFHVTDADAFEPVEAAVALLSTVRRLHPDELQFRAESFDRLAGGPRLRETIEGGKAAREIAAEWQEGLRAYVERRRGYLLYRRRRRNSRGRVETHEG